MGGWVHYLEGPPPPRLGRATMTPIHLAVSKHRGSLPAWLT